MKILVIDDSLAMRLIVQKTLREAGFGDADIEQAEDGAVGLDKIAADRPDLVLCDWNMPNMTGPELLEALNKENINLKFGFVTTESTAKMRAIADELGARFLIAKPFTAETFKDVLTPLMAA